MTETAHIWTRARIIEALQDEHARTGRAPTKQGWEKAAPEHPAAPTVYDKFGSWNAALEAAGLPTRRQGEWESRPMTARWDPDRVKHAIYEAAYKLRRVPTAADMKRLSRMFPDEFPYPSTVAYHMGSWNDGLIAVGYRPHRLTKGRRRRMQRCSRCQRLHWGFQPCPTISEAVAA